MPDLVKVLPVMVLPAVLTRWTPCMWSALRRFVNVFFLITMPEEFFTWTPA